MKKSPPKTSRRLISQMLASLLSFGLFVYFAFFLMHGDMGYFALRGLEQRMADSEIRRAQLVAEREVLENRVKLLRPTSLDLDMLDERARFILGFARVEERVILGKL